MGKNVKQFKKKTRCQIYLKLNYCWQHPIEPLDNKFLTWVRHINNVVVLNMVVSAQSFHSLGQWWNNTKEEQFKYQLKHVWLRTHTNVLHNIHFVFYRYCDCFANGEFCNNCNCNNCANNLVHEEERSRAIKSCLDRNPMAFHPKIGEEI